MLCLDETLEFASSGASMLCLFLREEETASDTRYLQLALVEKIRLCQMRLDTGEVHPSRHGRGLAYGFGMKMGQRGDHHRCAQDATCTSQTTACTKMPSFVWNLSEDAILVKMPSFVIIRLLELA